MSEIPDGVEVPTEWAADHDGWNTPTATKRLPVVIDPSIERHGELQTAPYGPTPVIVLKTWDERAYLHEVLHALLDDTLASFRDDVRTYEPGAFFHHVITRAEVGVLAAGFHYAPTEAATSEEGR